VSFTIQNGLCALSDVKAALKITDETDDDRISLAIDASSRLIETECNRRFWADEVASPRRYVSNDPWFVEVDDISTSEGLIVQSDYAGDGTFSTTWEAADYQLEPVNGIMEGEAGWPTTAIRAIRSLYFPVWGGIAYPKPYTQALVQVTAVWGWAAVPTRVVQACIIQTIATFRAVDVPFGATPFGESGVLRMKQSLHPTAAMLINAYREDEVLVA
jgi:Phage gp6-like head-tail connector protein